MVGSSIRDSVTAAMALKDIRPSTRRSYLVALKPFLDLEVGAVNVPDLNEVLLGKSNQNSRRKAVIALKACLDHPAVIALRVPEAVPRSYDLPDETTIRLARMTCPHETRLLLGMYAGLRLGELSATTHEDLQGRWLTVARQVDETTRRLVPVKTGAAIPVTTTCQAKAPFGISGDGSA